MINASDRSSESSGPQRPLAGERFGLSSPGLAGIGHVSSAPVLSVDPAELLTLDVLDAFLQRPAWHRDALCREHPAAWWFPERGEPSEPAKAVCGRCAVREECLTTCCALRRGAPLLSAVAVGGPGS